MNSNEIKILREKLSLNQEKFGQLFGVHPMTVSKWERGVLGPTPYQIALMAAFEKAATIEKVKVDLKNVLVAAGIAAALFFLLKYSQE